MSPLKRTRISRHGCETDTHTQKKFWDLNLKRMIDERGEMMVTESNKDEVT